MFTLDDFSSFTQIDPAQFMGVKVTKGNCDPFDCTRRNYFVSAFRSAESRIAEILAVRAGLSLRGETLLESSSAGYFRLQPGWEPITLKTYEVTATVSFPDVLTKKYKVRERVTIVSDELPAWEDCESFYDISVVFPDGNCKRFDVALAGVTVLAVPDEDDETIIHRTIMATAAAVNFLDIDNAVECNECVNDGSATYLTEVMLVVRTKQRGKARVYWPVPVASPCGSCDPCEDPPSEPDPCLDCCADTYVEACVRVSANRVATIESIPKPCIPYGQPIRYELDVVNKSLYNTAWAEAVAWLGMTNLAQEVCVGACNSISTSLWNEANGADVRFKNTPVYAMWARIFGIAKPGAQRAGAIVGTALNRVGITVL